MKTVLNKEIKEQLMHRIEKITGNEKPVWGKMSVHEMVCHSADQIKMSLGEIGTKYVGNKLMESLLKRMILWGMPTPKGKVETVREIKQGAGGTKPAALDDDKKRLTKLIDEFDAKYPADKKILHPAFGMMNKKEWGRLVYIHADYHLRQFGR